MQFWQNYHTSLIRIFCAPKKLKTTFIPNEKVLITQSLLFFSLKPFCRTKEAPSSKSEQRRWALFHWLTFSQETTGFQTRHLASRRDRCASSSPASLEAGRAMPHAAHKFPLSPSVDDRTCLTWLLPWTILLVPGLTLNSQPLDLRYASKAAPSPCFEPSGIRSTTALDCHRPRIITYSQMNEVTWHQNLNSWVQYYKHVDEDILKNPGTQWPTCHYHLLGHKKSIGLVCNNNLTSNCLEISNVTANNDRRKCEPSYCTVNWIPPFNYFVCSCFRLHSPHVTSTKDHPCKTLRTYVLPALVQGRGECGGCNPPSFTPPPGSIAPLVISSCTKCIQFVMIRKDVVLRMNGSGVVLYQLIAATCLSFHFQCLFSLLSNLGEIRIVLSIDFYNLYKGINVYFMFIHIKQEWIYS